MIFMPAHEHIQVTHVGDIEPEVSLRKFNTSILNLPEKFLYEKERIRVYDTNKTFTSTKSMLKSSLVKIL